jgi:hypothetical protein
MTSASSFENKPIGEVGWAASFQGRSYNSNSDTTTFTYSMAVDSSEKDLSHWVLGIPNCAQIDACSTVASPNAQFSCSGGSGDYPVDPTTGLNGWRELH